jgi:DNA-binding transcriptional MerR regulator
MSTLGSAVPRGSETETAIVRLYQDEELSIAAVAIKTGETVGTVRGVVERKGIVRHRTVIVSPGQVAGIVQACTKDGLSQGDVGARYGVSKAIVGRVLREHGGLLSPSEAASRAGITPDQLRRLAATGAVRYATGAGDNGRYRYYRAEMDRLRHLEALRWVFGDLYDIAAADGKMEAHRREGVRSLHSATPEELRALILEDLKDYETAMRATRGAR